MILKSNFSGLFEFEFGENNIKIDLHSDGKKGSIKIDGDVINEMIDAFIEGAADMLIDFADSMRKHKNDNSFN